MSDKPKSKVAKIQLTRGEFAAIPVARSSAEVTSLQQRGFKRVAAKGDRGNWFVCYPDQGTVFLVQFIARPIPAAGAVKLSETVEQVVARKNATRGCN